VFGLSERRTHRHLGITIRRPLIAAGSGPGPGQ
jgi:hypothetical protein